MLHLMPRARAPRCRLLLAGGLAGALLSCSPAAAAVINIAPTRVVIAKPGESGSLMLRNDAEQPVRFQVTAFHWTNTPSGDINLEPTKDLIFFPALFTLEPHQSRRLRVATSVRAVDRELSYRLIIEQLPASDVQPGQGVQMLVRASVPVFVQPPTLTARVTLDGLALADGAATFDLRNTGTVHLQMTEAVVRGRLRSGADAPEQRVKGWYLLPSESRRYRVPVPPEACRDWASLRVSVTFTNGFKEPLTEETPLPPGSCGG